MYVYIYIYIHMYIKPHILIYVCMSCVLDPSAFHLFPSLHMCTPKWGLFTFVPRNLHPPPPPRLPSIPRSLICDLFVTRTTRVSHLSHSSFSSVSRLCVACLLLGKTGLHALLQALGFLLRFELNV